MGSSTSGNHKTRKMAPYQRRAAIRFVENGKPVLEVARRYGVAPQYIYRLLANKHNILVDN